MITRAITENRHVDDNTDERCSIQSMITEIFIAQKSN